MVKNAPRIGQIAAMALFTLSVFGLLMFLWIAFGGSIPLRPESYRFKAEFPEASLLVQEADVRMAGVNVGKVKQKELAPGGRRMVVEMEIKPEFAPVKRDTRAILRQKSLLGETYVELTPGTGSAGNLSDHGMLARTSVEETTELDEIFRTFDPRTRENFRTWMREAGLVVAGDYPQQFNQALGNLGPFVESGSRLLDPLDRQRAALKLLVRDTGRVFGAISERDDALRGTIVNGQQTFRALAAHDDSLAETFRVFPTFLRETRATMTRLEGFARNTNPLINDLRGPASDLGPTLRDLADLSPDLKRLFRDLDPLIDASRSGLPAAQRFLGGTTPVLEAVHVFMPELNPILSYLEFSRAQLAGFIATGGGALGGNGVGGYTVPRTAGTPEHWLPQIAMIEPRSFDVDATRPPWERGNAYLAPNAYWRAIGLGVIESFDCKPAGGEVKDPQPQVPAPPCFAQPKSLFQNQQYPRLERGQAPLVPGPVNNDRRGNAPATVSGR